MAYYPKTCSLCSSIHAKNVLSIKIEKGHLLQLKKVCLRSIEGYFPFTVYFLSNAELSF